MRDASDDIHVGSPPGSGQETEASGRPALAPAARRALAEAEARRAAIDAKAAEAAPRPEQGGRGGLEPVRYEDWEIAGRAVDF